MKIENISDLYFIMSVFVPGFIFYSVKVSFTVNRETSRELTLIKLFTLTAYNYAACSPLIYILLEAEWLRTHPVVAAGGWFTVIFLSPVFLAILDAKLSASGIVRRCASRLGLQLIHKVPTGWDWQFGRIAAPHYLRVTLVDGSQILGVFGQHSMASSEREQHDIYIERVYRAGEGDAPWNEVPNSAGIYIPAMQIKHIEFWPL